MTGPSALEAVLIDMDGTLVSTEEHWYAAERTVMAELGGSWGPEDQAAFVGGPMEGLVAYMAARAVQPVDAAVVLDRLLREMQRLLRAEPITWLPGARELLEALTAEQVPCALVTASHRSLVDAVADSIGSDWFVATVSGDEVRHSKPHPEPYLTAAAALGADPARCIVIEDSPTGAASGQAAGCFVVAVPSLRAVDPGERRLVVPSLRGVDVALLRTLVPPQAA